MEAESDHYGEKNTEKALYFHISAEQSVLGDKQVRIHESTVACDWAGAVMPENH